MFRHMKAVTIHLDESIYSEFQSLARKSKRTASDLIREAMQVYRDRSKKNTHSMAEAPPPASVGAVLKPFSNRGDMLEDFFDRA